MSNALAIAAVTAALRNVLAQGVAGVADLADTVVTTQLPDLARSGATTANQINLFLYQAVPNAAWRNADPPPGRSGELGQPPLALNLYYLVITYGRDNDSARPYSHELLGRAMSVLHDHPILGAAELAAALPGNDVAAQIERIRFSLQPLSVEEIYRLWTGFQTPYRTSVAYEASVVLIDSLREAQTPLPVLRRGPFDRGAVVQTGVGSPFAAIASIAPTVDVVGGDTLTITGTNLGGSGVAVNFASAHLPQARRVAPAARASETQLRVTVPDDTDFPAGIYDLWVSVAAGSGDVRTSNVLALPIVPRITSGLPATLSAPEGALTVTLGCAPAVQPGQRVSLLLGDREIRGVSPTAPATTLTFTAEDVGPGTYPVRLRVDGADSTLLVDRDATPAAFDPRRRLTVT